MYGGAAHHRLISKILKEQGERLDSDPEYREQYIKKMRLDELASKMTPELWAIADAKYKYKGDKS